MISYSNEIEYVSIIIPAFNRYHYLEEVIDSIRTHADMPFEIVIHDDNSTDGTRQKIIDNLQDKVSSIILNNGLQLGLGESINRCTKIAGSNYVIMLNADCTITYPCFRDIINVLQKSYVGCLSLMTQTSYNPGIPAMNLTSNGSKFQLIRGIGAGCSLVFRKDTFTKIGGWDNTNVTSSNVDVNFMIRLIKAGYFITAMNSRDHDACIRNLSNERQNCKDSTIARGYYDVSYPKLFNLQKSKYIKLFDIHKSKRTLDDKLGEEIYAKLSRQRYDEADRQQQISYRAEEGNTNIEWADKFMHKLIKDDYSIDKTTAKIYNHSTDL